MRTPPATHRKLSASPGHPKPISQDPGEVGADAEDHSGEQRKGQPEEKQLQGHATREGSANCGQNARKKITFGSEAFEPRPEQRRA